MSEHNQFLKFRKFLKICAFILMLFLFNKHWHTYTYTPYLLNILSSTSTVKFMSVLEASLSWKYLIQSEGRRERCETCGVLCVPQMGFHFDDQFNQSAFESNHPAFSVPFCTEPGCLRLSAAVQTLSVKESISVSTWVRGLSSSSRYREFLLKFGSDIVWNISTYNRLILGDVISENNGKIY